MIAIGDLLQTTRVNAPEALTLARFAALSHTSSSAAADLAQLLHADGEATPLAQAALGAALWEPWRGPWPLDATLERAVAEQTLAASSPPTAELAPDAVATALACLSRKREPAAWVPAIYRDVEAALAQPPEDSPLPQPPLGWLGFVLADRKQPAEIRRARLRRATSAVECQVWFPELTPLDELVVRALEDDDWVPARERLRELSDDDPRYTAGELERAKVALQTSAPRSPEAEATLLALRSVGGEDVREAARALLAHGDPTTEPLAFSILHAASETPGPVAGADTEALGTLCRFFAWSAQRGGEPPQDLLDLLIERGPSGLALSAQAGSLERSSLAQLLAAALPVDQALKLVRPLGDQAVLVHDRGDGSWDATLTGQAVVLRPLGDRELPASCLATPPGLGETPFAIVDVAPLGRVAVCHRVGGLPAGPSPVAWHAVGPALLALHRAGFALGTDPLQALRQTADGWSFRGLDLEAPVSDPAVAQQRDVARLLERAQAALGETPRSLADLQSRLTSVPTESPPLWAELRDFALDVFANGEPFSVAELCARFGDPTLAVSSAREVVLSLDAELHAAGRGCLTREGNGHFRMANLLETAHA